MTYDETIEYLYAKLPVFQKIGLKALKPKLTNIIALCEALGNPQDNFKSIHVAGTNGKGSTSHMLASILIEKGLKVGLYTSPHLKDYRERFRINGEMAPKSYIIEFIENYSELIKKIKPSFFEVSVAIAFKFFSDEKVDIAVIEVGLGGRFDSTNIISNLLFSLITNIGYDHMDILGDTLEKIAFEKAGIIKKGIPVIVSEYSVDTYKVFEDEAKKNNSEIKFASKNFDIFQESSDLQTLNLDIRNIYSQEIFKLSSGLVGQYQKNNIIGVLEAYTLLNKLGYNLSKEHLINGIKNVIVNTSLKGRWQILQNNPLVICDTGHNEHALKITLNKLFANQNSKIHLILGFVKDKDLEKVFSLLPLNANYYFCDFDSFRALKASELQKEALKYNFESKIYNNVNQALEQVLSNYAKSEDIVFIGGSTYLVAELNNI
ncbi:bifunctional folylpolyglutamate synthase/dihydrofolate synthase [Lacihabitans sp. LS3-19]|uniref:bifunctional folylpolyglutamate synthase/dihydrofolate synthase n=1 Tax=Lacihabitans sp. LS3-19 TaxID=2487335 RepID=UPI0020CBF934|nr:folylpolyglutamate synthase/dihydrofolate synthase family protein [Lacihabitans sp. LS3-19]MCP9768196.1 bifunctional folylpolyglutamate synthase/dihydrofolate synthase [Lacihabitans sp. LS3-19]